MGAGECGGLIVPSSVIVRVCMAEAESMATALSRSPLFVRGGHLHALEVGCSTTSKRRCHYGLSRSLGYDSRRLIMRGAGVRVGRELEGGAQRRQASLTETWASHNARKGTAGGINESVRGCGLRTKEPARLGREPARLGREPARRFCIKRDCGERAGFRMIK